MHRYPLLSSFARVAIVFALAAISCASSPNEVAAADDAAVRPNVLWITSEDHGPEMGCYGDKYATTPNVDRLAAKGLLYMRCWSNAPVCAPARTTLITGMYAPSTGSEHMRSMLPMPKGTKMFPQILREAGYYTSNNSKEDYNLAKNGKVWDESSGKAHYRNRAQGQPFFAVFNSTKSHESQIRSRPHKQIHDPAKVRVPAYHPDTPEVRQDWAQYYDKVAEADADAGRVLAQLEADGLTDDTIVFYFGDHGSGMPRSKRWTYNSGLHVPLVVYIPDKFKHLATDDYKSGGKSDRLVSFVDFAPTVLSLAGIEPPAWMQGHAFLGKHAAPPQPYIYGFRGRMDERLDLVRSTTDGRFIYIRNYMPHKIYGQHIDYMFQTPTTRVWKRLHDEGKLTPQQDAFWNAKPPEELYDLKTDRDEVRNLAASSEHRDKLLELRTAQRDLAARILDVGFLPEGEAFSRSAGGSPYDMARGAASEENTVNEIALSRIVEVAERASMLESDAVPELKKLLADGDSAVRYWASMGLLMRGKSAVSQAGDDLATALADKSPHVRIAAAEALGRYGKEQSREAALKSLVELASLDDNDVFTSIAALNAIDALGPRAASLSGPIAKLPKRGQFPDGRYSSYVPRLLEDLQSTSRP